VTESAGIALRDRGYAGNMSILPLGVTQNHLRKSANEKIPPDSNTVKPFVIGYVGRLVPEKGLEVLLRALALLTPANWECQLIGEGKIKEELVKLSIDLSIQERVRFLGYVSHGEISSYMNRFSVLVLPSLTKSNWAEQFGRVIIEALAAGIPVIGTNSGEIPFLIRKLQGGLIVEEGDPAALAGAINTLASDPALAAKFAEQGRRNVEKYFLESTIAADFVAGVTGAMRLRKDKAAIA
jgi:glycosyltransferase involved in cell wall biosynthesis